MGGDIWYECSRDDAHGRLQRIAFASAKAFLVSNPWSFAHARRFEMLHSEAARVCKAPWIGNEKRLSRRKCDTLQSSMRVIPRALIPNIASHLGDKIGAIR